MESHKCIFQCVIIFSFDGFFVHILRYRVVDIKQCNDVVAYYLSDKFTQCTIDINFAGNRDTLGCQTAVYIARNKSKLCLECRPAFSCQSYIFTISSVVSNPVFQSQFVLSKFRKDFWFLVSFTKLCFHFFNDFRNSFIAFMFVECFEKIQFRVFFDFYAKIVKLFDRCITSKEVCRTWSKADDLKVA